VQRDAVAGPEVASVDLHLLGEEVDDVDATAVGLVVAEIVSDSSITRPGSSSAIVSDTVVA
jgi:hypothetical protein